MIISQHYRRYRWLAVGWMLIIIGFTTIPTTPWAPEIRGITLLRQGLFYALMAFLLCRALFKDGRMTLRRVLVVTLIASVYGALDEWHQAAFFISGREARVSDWLSSTLGALAVSFVMWQKEVGDYSFLFTTARGDMIKLSLSNLFNNGVTFLTGILVAYLVSTQSFGVYSVATNVVMMVLAVSELGLSISIVRFFNRYTDSLDKHRVLQAGLTIRAVIFLAMLVASYPVGKLLSVLLSPEQPIVLELTVAIICAAALGLWSFIRTQYQASQNYSLYAGLTMRYGIVRLFMVTIVSRLGFQDPVYFLVALYLLGPLVVTGWELYKSYGHLGLHFNKQVRTQVGELLSYGKWVLIGGILYPFSFSLPLFILMRMSGAEAAGVYGIGLMFVAIMSPLNDAVRTFVIPKISSLRRHDDAHEYIARTMRLAIPYALLLATIMVASSIVYGLFFSGKYPGGLWVLELLVLASGLAIFGGILNSVAHYLGLPHLDAWINVGRIIFVVITSVLAIPHFGALGAATGVAVAAVLGEFIVFWLISRRLGRVE